MRNVTLKCRNDDTKFTMASVAEANPETMIEDMQNHMDNYFLAQCGECNKRNWEVVGVTELDITPEFTTQDYINQSRGY